MKLEITESYHGEFDEDVTSLRDKSIAIAEKVFSELSSRRLDHKSNPLIKSYVVPSTVRNAAKRGLRLRRMQPSGSKSGLDTREAGSQGIGSGVARARDLIAGKVSEDTIRRMHAYFSRHAKNYKLDKDKKDYQDKGYVAGLLWGGEEGRIWASKMVSQFNESDVKKSNSRRGGQVDALDEISDMMFSLYQKRIKRLNEDFEQAIKDR